MNLYIPQNDYKILEGYYTINKIVKLLRENYDNPKIIYFIADMMEE